MCFCTSVCSPMVRIIAFQAIDPGVTPGKRKNITNVMLLAYLLNVNNLLVFTMSLLCLILFQQTIH